MSKLAKSLAVGTLAAGLAVLASASPVSANAYYKDYKSPHFGSYSSNDIHFNERYDKASSFFYSLKEDEKKQDSEHFSFNSENHRDNNKKHHGKGYGGYGNSVSIDYSRDNSFSKSFEETKALTASESYSSDFRQSSDRGNYGKYGGHASNSVQASVNFHKEKSFASSVKAEVAHSSSVNTSVNLNNYGPHGSYSNSVSAYENVDHYSKVEATVAAYEKEQSSVNYSADTSRANYGGCGCGGSSDSTSINYSADKSYEASKKVTYSAEESTSYSSGFSSHTSQDNGGYGYKH